MRAERSASDIRTDLHESAEALLKSVIERLHEFVQLRGGNFNVFQVLDLEHDEDRLHSRFIAELLDPSGSHGQGTAFLELFLRQIGRMDWIRAQYATVEREKGIGPKVVAGENSTGGRIDIFISDHERHLSIENKIWSVEGEKQVTRYCNYPPDRPDRNFVLFLTLQGDKADTEKENYRAISYPEHILPWLESCRPYADDSPILRETINQYIITVRGLVMDSKIREAMKRHYKAAWEIRRTFDDMVSEQKQDLVQQVLALIKPKRQQGWQLDLQQNRRGLVLSHEESWGKVQVTWQDDWLGIHVPGGWADSENWDSGRREHILNEFPYLDGEEARYEPCWGYVPKHRFRSQEGIELLFVESKRSELARDISNKLVDLADYCDNKFRDVSV